MIEETKTLDSHWHQWKYLRNQLTSNNNKHKLITDECISSITEQMDDCIKIIEITPSKDRNDLLVKLWVALSCALLETSHEEFVLSEDIDYLQKQSSQFDESTRLIISAIADYLINNTH